MSTSPNHQVTDDDFKEHKLPAGKIIKFYPGIYPNSGAKTYDEQIALLRNNEYVLSKDDALLILNNCDVWKNTYLRTATMGTHFHVAVGGNHNVAYMTIRDSDRISFVSFAVGLRI